MSALLRLALPAVKAVRLSQSVLCPVTFMITARATPVFFALLTKICRPKIVKPVLASIDETKNGRYMPHLFHTIQNATHRKVKIKDIKSRSTKSLEY
jgi:hypothetical protein